MKRFCSVLALFMAAVLALTLCGCAQTVTDETAPTAPAETCDPADFDFTVVDGKAQITGYRGKGGELVIPSELGGAEVSSIGENVFFKNNTVTGVWIPDSVTSIGSFAFSDCSALQSVHLPAGLSSIDEWAFASCSSLKSIEIPAGVTEISSYVFCECASLSSITIPAGVKEIGGSAFKECSSLNEITLPNALRGIEDYAFCDCASLKSIEIPAGTEELGDHVFARCSSLESVSIPASVNEIGEYAFYMCPALDNVKLPEGIKEIEEYTFSDCSSLKSVTLPSTLKEIDAFGFANCVLLSEITLPDGIESVHPTAFSGCVLLNVNGKLPDSGNSNDSDSIISHGDPTQAPTEKAPSGGAKRMNFQWFSIELPDGVINQTSADNNGNPIVKFFDKYNYELGKSKGYTGYGELFTIFVCPTKEVFNKLGETLPNCKMLGNYNGWHLIAAYPNGLMYDSSDSASSSSYNDKKSRIDDMLSSIKAL